MSGEVILGADTETFDGYVKLLGFSDGAFVEPSRADYTDELLDALYAKAEGVTWVVFWNLGFDFTAIVKPWVVEHADTFRATHYANIKRRQRLAVLGLKEEDEGLSPEEARERQQLQADLDGDETVERFDTERYHVVLIGSKGFSLTPRSAGKRDHHKERRWYFDAAPWYSSSFGGVSLDYAAKKFLGEGKSNEDLGISRERIGSERGYYEAHREAIVKYCIQDCALTARLMARTVEAFEKLGYPFPDHPFSRASVSREYLKTKGVLESTMVRYERLAGNSYHELWDKSFRGGVFVLMGAGRWDSPFSLDINSAYPDAMVRFPSLEDAEVVDQDDPRFASCFFRFYRIRLLPTPRTPTREQGEARKMYGWKNEEASLCVTGLDLDILREFGEPFVIEDACGIFTPHADVRPLAYLAEVFGRKSEVKKTYGADSVEYANLKILLNGTYGILAQRRPRTTRYTNLIYASYVTAWCRAKLWRAVRETEERGDYVVSLATDGLLVAGEGSREWWRNRDSPRLGEWTYEPHEEAVCFESGVGFIKDEGKEFTVKRRGVPSLTREALEACEGVEWTELTSRPVKLRTALIQKRTAYLGVFEEHERTLCPVKSYADAGQSFPKVLRTTNLGEFFRRHWPLRLRGQGTDRLTPPTDPILRREFDRATPSHRPPKGYMLSPSYTSVETSKRSKRREAHAAESGAGETVLVPSSEGSERGKASRRVRPRLPSIQAPEDETVSNLEKL